MKGDYHRYLAKFKVGGERKEAAEDTMLAYKAAQEVALADLAPTHPIRLGSAHLDCVVVTGIPVIESNSLLLDEETAVSGTTTTHVVPVPSAPPLPPSMMTTTTMPPPMMTTTTEQVQNQTTPMLVPVQVPEESNVLRSVLIGFLGGAVAVATVLIGGGTTD